MRNWSLKIGYRWHKAWKIIPAIIFFPSILSAQENENDTLLLQATLEKCIRYKLPRLRR